MVLQDRAKNTRAAIVAGAAVVFEEFGYGSASLTQVAKVAQVTKGALYFHFKSKEDLARAVIGEEHRLVTEHGAAILAGNHSGLKAMILMCQAFGLQLVREPVVKAGIRLTFEATAFGLAVREPYEDWVTTMERLAVQGKEEGQIRSSVEPAALARYVVASFTGVQLLSDVLTERADVVRRIEEMWGFLLPAIMHEDFPEVPAALTRLISTCDPAPAQPAG